MRKTDSGYVAVGYSNGIDPRTNGPSRPKGDCSNFETFIIRLEKNQVGFVKSFTDLITSGLSPLKATMKELQLRKVHIYPWFHEEVKESFGRQDALKITKIAGSAPVATRHFHPSTCAICAISTLRRIAKPSKASRPDLRRSHFAKPPPLGDPVRTTNMGYPPTTIIIIDTSRDTITNISSRVRLLRNYRDLNLSAQWFRALRGHQRRGLPDRATLDNTQIRCAERESQSLENWKSAGDVGSLTRRATVIYSGKVRVKEGMAWNAGIMQTVMRTLEAMVRIWSGSLIQILGYTWRYAKRYRKTLFARRLRIHRRALAQIRLEFELSNVKLPPELFELLDRMPSQI
ncbi:hypothetical protein BD410DRAFT_889012 [Rickenella mellea]|uniref:Uncharacterized protein n=1 Tax=Rickenella mellea TaxID=50990 RepID=A0A4Y7PLZ9_9AGAM|nr:hypothetical protein BD410DRAFT_889012 [Rickenella mellea]